MSRFSLTHQQFYGAKDYIQAQDSLNAECDVIGDDEPCFAFGAVYLINEANRVSYCWLCFNIILRDTSEIWLYFSLLTILV